MSKQHTGLLNREVLVQVQGGEPILAREPSGDGGGLQNHVIVCVRFAIWPSIDFRLGVNDRHGKARRAGRR